MTEHRSPLRTIVTGTLLWWIPLSVITVAALYLTDSGLQSHLTLWGAAEVVFGRVALIFPFAAFAGGLVGSGEQVTAGRARIAMRVAAVMLVLGTASYVGGSGISPFAEYRQAISVSGEAAAVRYPSGGRTPAGLVRLRATVLEQPRTSYGFSTDLPFELPPNWLTYLIHQPIAFALLAIPNALLGLVIGWLTTGLSPPRRRHVRWALGLIVAAAFMTVEVMGSQWVRSSPANSGIIGAWLPLAVALLELGLASAILARRNRLDLHAPAGPHV